jgi:hypothetical protein
MRLCAQCRSNHRALSNWYRPGLAYRFTPYPTRTIMPSWSIVYRYLLNVSFCSGYTSAFEMPLAYSGKQDKSQARREKKYAEGSQCGWRMKPPHRNSQPMPCGPLCLEDETPRYFDPLHKRRTVKRWFAVLSVFLSRITHYYGCVQRQTQASMRS